MAKANISDIHQQDGCLFITGHMKYISTYSSPMGEMIMASDGEALRGLWFEGQKYAPHVLPWVQVCDSLHLFEQTRHWLDIYFSGKKPNFLPPLKPEGTHFRQQVWKLLLDIPYGSTATYGQLGARLAAANGCKTMSAQAIGGAVGHNPIAIIIPCHRVVGTDGRLTGYAGGLERKSRLLSLEQRM